MGCNVFPNLERRDEMILVELVDFHSSDEQDRHALKMVMLWTEYFSVQNPIAEAWRSWLSWWLWFVVCGFRVSICNITSSRLHNKPMLSQEQTR